MPARDCQEVLFVYGTLLNAEVLEAVIGVRLDPEPATLDGYERFRVAGAPYPGIVLAPGATVRGGLYRGLGARDLERMDAFEGDLYQRARVSLTIGDGARTPAWTYVVPPESRALLSNESWDEARYLERDHQDFLARARRDSPAQSQRDGVGELTGVEEDR